MVGFTNLYSTISASSTHRKGLNEMRIFVTFSSRSHAKRLRGLESAIVALIMAYVEAKVYALIVSGDKTIQTFPFMVTFNGGRLILRGVSKLRGNLERDLITLRAESKFREDLERYLLSPRGAPKLRENLERYWLITRGLSKLRRNLERDLITLQAESKFREDLEGYLLSPRGAPKLRENLERYWLITRGLSKLSNYAGLLEGARLRVKLTCATIRTFPLTVTAESMSAKIKRHLKIHNRSLIMDCKHKIIMLFYNFASKQTFLRIPMQEVKV